LRHARASPHAARLSRLRPVCSPMADPMRVLCPHIVRRAPEAEWGAVVWPVLLGLQGPGAGARRMKVGQPAKVAHQAAVERAAPKRTAERPMRARARGAPMAAAGTKKVSGHSGLRAR
jgi:hypothetical protein